MSFITSLLALAAIFVVLSTLTTAFVETIQALAKQRVKGLEQQLGAMFDNLFTTEKGAGADRAKFIAAMTTNPAARVLKPNPLWLIGTANSGKLDWLDLRRFIQQLANTEIGDALAAKEKVLKHRLTEIAANFERYGEGMSVLFQRRSGIYAAITGVGLAAFMNVDGALMAERLFSDAGLAQRVVVSLPEEELKRFMDAEAAFRAKCVDGDQATKDECVRDNLAGQALKVGQSHLEGLGLPIGRAYFPYCETQTEAAVVVDERCSSIEKPDADSWKIKRMIHNLFSGAAGLSWLLSIGVTGALIGLGAPFWFDLYKRLAALAPVAGKASEFGRSLGVEVAKSKPEAGEPVETPARVITPDDLVKIFNFARAK